MNIHPQVVHFPIAILLVAGGFYLVSIFHQERQYHWFAYLLHGIGVVSSALAVLSGRWGSNGINIPSTARSIMNQHEWLAYGVLWGFALLWIWQYLRQNRMNKNEKVGFLVVFGLVAMMLAYSSHLGGTMVYDYGIGVVK